MAIKWEGVLAFRILGLGQSVLLFIYIYSVYMVFVHMISCLCITQVGILVFLVGYNTICTLSARIFH